MDKILITSDILLDTEFGLIKMMSKKYNNKQLVDIKEPFNDIGVKYDLINNHTNNPLDIILVKQYTTCEKDELLNSFFESEYDSILENSIFTDVDLFFSTIIKTSFLDVILLCKNVQEKQLFKDKFGNINVIVDQNYNVQGDEYDIIYTRYYTNLIKMHNPVYKSIYLPDIEFNKIENISDKDILLELGISQLQYITLYKLEPTRG